MTNMNNFLPPEILQKILYHLDGQTLIAFGEVCDYFYEIVNSSAKSMHEVWKQNCYKEIPEDSRIDILHKLYPKYWLDPSGVRWNIVYKCWTQRHDFENWKQAVKMFTSEHYCISCILISGNWILIGTINRGTLIAFNIDTNEEKVMYKGADIIDMQLRCKTEQFLIDEQSDFLPGIAHDVIILNLDTKADAVIDLHTGYTKLIPRPVGLYQSKYFENWKVKVTAIGGTTILNVSNTSAPHERYHTYLETCTVKFLDIWKGKVVTSAFSPNQLGTVIFNYKLNNPEYIHSFNKQGKLFSWHATIFAETSGQLNKHELRIAVGDRSRSYYPFRELFVHVQCVLYYCCALFLGTDIGILYAFQLSNEDELLNLDLTEYAWCYELCCQPIISILVQETEKKRILFVSTPCSVFQLPYN